MKKFEYIINKTVDEKIEKYLNKMGANGWELVNVYFEKSSSGIFYNEKFYNGYYEVFLKREIK